MKYKCSWCGYRWENDLPLPNSLPAGTVSHGICHDCAEKANDADTNAAFIVEACNNYEALKAREAELVAACKAWLLWDSEVYAAKETGESEYSYGELQAMRVDAEYKARAAIKGKKP